MLGSVVLDVAIGMAFVYLLLSLIASVLQETVAAFLQLRPTNLLKGIQSLFSGDSLWGKDLLDSLYNHGLVRGLYSDPVEDHKPRLPPAHGLVVAVAPAGLAVPAPAARPSRLARLFRVFKASLRALLLPIFRIGPVAVVRGVSDQTLLPAYIPARTFAVAMTDILNPGKHSGDQLMQSITHSLAEHHWLYRENKAGQALYTLALNAEGDLNKFQKLMEHWYSDSMDRASGWYKRHVQRILLYLGVLLAICCNVDSFHVARTLWFDRDTRLAMEAAADEYAKKQAPPPVPAAAGDADAKALQTRLEGTVSAFNKVTTAALLPVGWKQSPLVYLRGAWHFAGSFSNTEVWWGTFGNTLWRLCQLFLGWIMTGLAISLGAPFWFDTLNKFMVVRNTVKPREKSQPEASKN
jgi:hypothetical protein